MKILLIYLVSLLVINSCTFIPKQSGLFTYVDPSGKKKSVRTLSGWEQKRQQTIQGMESAMGRLPDRLDLPPLNMVIIDSLRGENYTRLNIRFTVAENEILPAYLYLPYPNDPKRKYPAMIALHGTSEIGKETVDGKSKNRGYAKELAERGYVVIAPDYPSMGDLKDYDFSQDRYQSGTMKGIFDHMRCVDLLMARSEVDTSRIGAIGHSLGGHNAMFLAAFDKRIKVTVSSCGWTLFDYYDLGETASKNYGGRLGPWAQERYMPLMREKYHLNSEKFPFDFDEIIASISPRAFFSNSPVDDSNFAVAGVRKGIKAATEVYSWYKKKDNLKALYPERTGHDFPPQIRLEAYHFIDSIFGFTPKNIEIK